MILLASANPNLFAIVLISLVVIGLGVLLRYFHQPYVVAFIIAGVLFGEHGFEVITDKEVIAAIGEFGLILLLFFIGMETSLPDLMKRWKFALLGTTMQIVSSILIVGLIGYFFNLHYHADIVSDFFYQLTIVIISLTLLISPFWIALAKKNIYLE